jgi:hypothetical protein
LGERSESSVDCPPPVKSVRRLPAARLDDVEPGNPATFVSVAVLLGVIAPVAGYIPGGCQLGVLG